MSKEDMIGIIVGMLQQMNMQELDLVWRVAYGLTEKKEARG